MTQSRFFQISLLLPFMIWGLCLGIFSFAYKEGAVFILNNLYNAYRVFVPYLVFAAVLWKFAYHKPYQWFVLMASVIPVVWGIFFVLFYLLSTLVTSGTPEKGYVLLIMAFWAMVIAYLVECIPLLLLVILKHDFKSDEVNADGKIDAYLSESRPGA
ncbi:MAG: hypothetical protein M0Z60_01010 [Nitrospiraceae bacterium]|nr:hypothetical protein [Nitrospiraceae bacterium]